MSTAKTDSTQIYGPYPAGIPEHQIPFFYDKPYADRIGATLMRMPVGGIFDIASNVRTENREKFVNVVKTYIDHDFGKNDGWLLEFNADYSRIQKVQTLARMLADVADVGRHRPRNWRDEYPSEAADLG